MADLSMLGVAAALGSAASWAVGAFLFKALGEVLPPLALTLAKGACSVLLLGAVMVLAGAAPLGWRPLALLAVSGVLGISLGDTLFFDALQGLGPQPLLFLALLGQVLTIALAAVGLGEVPSGQVCVGAALVIAGVAVVLQESLAQEGGGKTRQRAVVVGLLAVACMSASNVVAKAGLAEQSDTILATFVRMLAGTLGVLCFGLASRRLKSWTVPFRSGRLLALFLASVAVVTFGGFWLGIVAFKHSPVAVAATLTSTEPVFALLLSSLVLGKRISLQTVAGTCTTVLGVVFLCSPGVLAALANGL